MTHTRVMIRVTVFAGDGGLFTTPNYGDVQGETAVVTFPCENYGDLLEQLIERATDEYIDNLEGAKGLDEE